MNKEMKERFRTAADFQKKAILALLPESTAGHIRTIGNEMKMMVAEMLVGCAKKAAAQDGEKPGHSGGVKKVDIG